ncbi:MAG: hypothetical protein ACI80I_001801, partial [Akkermansiaceae bacterium]
VINAHWGVLSGSLKSERVITDGSGDTIVGL